MYTATRCLTSKRSTNIALALSRTLTPTLTPTLALTLTLTQTINRAQANAFRAVSTSPDAEGLLPFRIGRFHSVHLDVETLGEYVEDTSDFSVKLFNTITKCRADGKTHMWLQVPMSYSHYIGVAGMFGFRYHHALDQTAHLLLWLQDGPATVPPFATHHVGVAGCVLNDKRELLVVKELSKSSQWKLPGGYTERGEDIPDTAVREVFEETSIRTTFEGVLAFRHQHAVLFGQSDLYAICLLKPLNQEIRRCENEISEAKWMPVAEVKSSSEHPMIRSIAELMESDPSSRAFRVCTQPSTIPGRAPYTLFLPKL